MRLLLNPVLRDLAIAYFNMLAPSQSIDDLYQVPERKGTQKRSGLQLETSTSLLLT